MKGHGPKGYKCPICLGVEGVESEHTLLRQDDLVYRDDLVSVFINSFWVKTVEGHVIVVPNKHIENLYEMPGEVGCRIFQVSGKVAKAMKEAYGCDGITVRQNNEPAGDQHAFHYHMHIFPRYVGDKFNEEMAKKSILSDPDDRRVYADKLRRVVGES